MKQITNFSELHEALAFYLDERKSILHAYNLVRMKQLMPEIGNPQEKLKIIHIAGTSGKTSTSYYIASLLQTAGYKVGLTVSPHLVEINERVQINSVPLPEKKFCQMFTDFREQINPNLSFTPTYFEILIAFAFWCFEQEKVDYAVVETGLGGRLDATNVVENPDKICVITDIGLDHTQILGKTVEKISTEKAGIIHEGNQVLIHKQPREIIKIFEDRAAEVKAKMHIYKEAEFEEAAGLPEFQKRNWSLAKRTFEMVSHREGLPELSFEKLKKAASIQVPGRLEKIHIHNTDMLLDGAHNPQKLAALGHSLQTKYPGQKIAAAVSFVGYTSPEKIAENAATLAGFCTRIILVPFATGDEQQKTSADIQAVKAAFEKFKNVEISIAKDLDAGIAELATLDYPVKLIAGSLYLAGTVKKHITSAKSKN